MASPASLPLSPSPTSFIYQVFGYSGGGKEEGTSKRRALDIREPAFQAIKPATEETPDNGNRTAMEWISASFLKRTKAGRQGGGIREWRELILALNKGKRLFNFPKPSSKPKIRRGLQPAVKNTASSFHQLLNGHAVIAASLKGKRKWISDKCWWCNRGRQPREHLQIHTLWGKVGGVSGDVGGSTLKVGRASAPTSGNPMPGRAIRRSRICWELRYSPTQCSPS